MTASHGPKRSDGVVGPLLATSVLYGRFFFACRMIMTCNFCKAAPITMTSFSAGCPSFTVLVRSIPSQLSPNALWSVA